jgi:hypothetical protein
MMKKQIQRCAKSFRYKIPSRQEVADIFRALIERQKTPEEVSNWATEFIIYDDPQIYPEVNDSVVWEALKALAGADLPSTDRKYLYEATDFEEWLQKLMSEP